MALALYRKYRPSKLSEVIGQDSVTGTLTKALANKKISHAYLFIGPRGTGKTSVARILAHAVNDFKYTLEDDYVDIIEIDGASNRGIDHIRELREKALIAPTAGKYKIYIIDEVHMLTKEAFNALLKTLEEPPAHTIFILATTDAHKVPATITSRAQIHSFQLVDLKTMVDFLATVAKKEHIQITKKALEIIAGRGEGSFRDSLSLLDQIATLKDAEINETDVIAALGLPSEVKIKDLLDQYLRQDVVKITTSLQELLRDGSRPETLAAEMIKVILTQPKPELLPLLSKLTEVKAPFAEARLLLALLNETTFSAPTSTPASVSTPISVAPTVSSSVPTPKTNTKPALAPESTSAKSAKTDFDWEDFLEKTQKESRAAHSQLLKSRHKLTGNTLELYPTTNFGRKVLSKDSHLQLFREIAPNLKIVVHEPTSPTSEQKDAVLTKISDIMGGEVKNDGGKNPF